MLQQKDFKINVAGMSLNDHVIDGSDQYKVGFVDSGTTFAYFPRNLFLAIRTHFEWFCK